MSFNGDKCPVMHIGLNHMQSNYNMSNRQLPTTNQQRDLETIITNLKTSSGKNKQRKAAELPTEYWGSLPAISRTITKN